MTRGTDAHSSVMVDSRRAEPLPGAAQAPAGAPLILVVDDHPTNRMVVRLQLNALGYACEEVASGADALASWSERQFALVLTDCNMPEMSGYSLSRRIREAEMARGWSRTPIIACSADVQVGVVQACMDAGMDDYISKPIELTVLADKIRRWMPGAAVTGGEDAAKDMSVDACSAAAVPACPVEQRPRPAAGTVITSRVLEQFRRVNKVDIEQLLTAAEQGDMPAVAHLAHRIKGACGFIDAAPMASVCGMVEQAGRAGDGPAVTWLMDVLKAELERLDAHLDTL